VPRAAHEPLDPAFLSTLWSGTADCVASFLEERPDATTAQIQDRMASSWWRLDVATFRLRARDEEGLLLSIHGWVGRAAEAAFDDEGQSGTLLLLVKDGDLWRPVWRPEPDGEARVRWLNPVLLPDGRGGSARFGFGAVCASCEEEGSAERFEIWEWTGDTRVERLFTVVGGGGGPILDENLEPNGTTLEGDILSIPATEDGVAIVRSVRLTPDGVDDLGSALPSEPEGDDADGVSGSVLGGVVDDVVVDER